MRVLHLSAYFISETTCRAWIKFDITRYIWKFLGGLTFGFNFDMITRILRNTLTEYYSDEQEAW
jgi:hypothetical protein